VGGGVVGGDDLIPAFAQQLVIPDKHGTYGYLALILRPVSQGQGAPHPLFVIGDIRHPFIPSRLLILIDLLYILALLIA
jgi:hypothetical protein